MKVYKEKKLSERIYERIFDSADSDNFEWHRDAENRKVVVLEAGSGWKFQLDNQLPVDLFEGVILTIPKNNFHRIIAGDGKLKIRLIKDFDIIS